MVDCFVLVQFPIPSMYKPVFMKRSSYVLIDIQFCSLVCHDTHPPYDNIIILPALHNSHSFNPPPSQSSHHKDLQLPSPPSIFQNNSKLSQELIIIPKPPHLRQPFPLSSPLSIDSLLFAVGLRRNFPTF